MRLLSINILVCIDVLYLTVSSVNSPATWLLRFHFSTFDNSCICMVDSIVF